MIFNRQDKYIFNRSLNSLQHPVRNVICNNNNSSRQAKLFLVEFIFGIGSMDVTGQNDQEQSQPR